MTKPLHKNFVDITGKRFGKLTVVSLSERTKYGYLWECTCDCGNTCFRLRTKMESGHALSCGCLIDEGRRSRAKHRMMRTPEHRAWMAMRRRCNSPSDKRYEYYGGRGIRVCAEWDADFNAFYRDVGQRPSPNHSLDRIDVNGNYEPGNVRWATKIQQAQNKRNVRTATINGVEKALSEWAREYGQRPKLVRARVVDRGWNVEKALTTPSGEYHKR